MFALLDAGISKPQPLQGGKIVAMGEDDTKRYWVSKEPLKHIEEM
jgi:hypothetical protein